MVDDEKKLVSDNPFSGLIDGREVTPTAQPVKRVQTRTAPIKRETTIGAGRRVGPTVAALEEAQKPEDSLLKKAGRFVLPKKWEERFGIAEQQVRKTQKQLLQEGESARQSEIRLRTQREHIAEAGVTEEQIQFPSRFLPEGYEEPESFTGQLREGVVSGYYNSIRPAAGFFAEQVGKEIGNPELIKWGEESGDKAVAYLLQHPELLPPEDLPAFLEGGFADKRAWARTIGETIPFVLSVIGASAAAGFITRSPTAASSTAYGSIYAIERANSYRSMIERGIAPDKAGEAANVYGAVATVLEQGLGFIPSKIAKAVLPGQTKKIVTDSFKGFLLKKLTGYSTKFLKKVGEEGFEEGAQQLAQNLVTKWLDESQPVWEGVAESVAAGAVGSLGFLPVDIIAGDRTKRVDGVAEKEVVPEVPDAPEKKVVAPEREFKGLSVSEVTNELQSLQEAVKDVTGDTRDRMLQEISNLQDVFQSEIDGVKADALSITDTEGRRIGGIEVARVGEDKYAFSVDVNVGSTSLIVNFDATQTEGSFSDAYQSARQSLEEWIENVKTSLPSEDSQRLERIEESLKGFIEPQTSKQVIDGNLPAGAKIRNVEFSKEESEKLKESLKTIRDAVAEDPDRSFAEIAVDKGFTYNSDVRLLQEYARRTGDRKFANAIGKLLSEDEDTFTASGADLGLAERKVEKIEEKPSDEDSFEKQAKDEGRVFKEVPLSLIGGLEPQPKPFPSEKRKVEEPVRIVLTENGDFILEEGNHRYHQAIFNKDKTIPSFIRLESGVSEKDLDKAISPKKKAPKKEEEVVKKEAEEKKTVRDVALDMLRVYVHRGDSFQSVKSGQLGSFNGVNNAQIKGDKVHVEKVNGKEVEEVFTLKSIFDELTEEKAPKKKPRAVLPSTKKKVVARVKSRKVFVEVSKLSSARKRVLKTGKIIRFEDVSHRIQTVHTDKGAITKISAINLSTGQKAIIPADADIQLETAQPIIDDKKAVIVVDDLSAGVLEELKASAPGERMKIDGEYIGIPSSFPSWIPEGLRLSKIVQPVVAHINADTKPTKAAEVRLYDVVVEQIRLRKEAEKEMLASAGLDSIDEIETMPENLVIPFGQQIEEELKEASKTLIEEYEDDTTAGDGKIEGRRQDIEEDKGAKEKIDTEGPNHDEFIAKLRAKYGETVPLYHQTDRSSLNSILKGGIKKSEDGKEDGVYTTLGQPESRKGDSDNFVHLKINLPIGEIGKLFPEDATYYTEESGENPDIIFKNFLENDGMNGGDIIYIEHIPAKWIEEVVTAKVSPSEIDAELARRAFEGTSFSPEKRGVDIQQEFADTLNSIYEELSNEAKTDEAKVLLDAEFDIFKDRYKRAYDKWLSSKSRQISPMITGPANFPVARNRKAIDSTMKRGDEASEVLKKGVKAIKKKLKALDIAEQGGETVIAQKNLEKEKALLEMMKDANKIARSKKLSDKEKVTELVKLEGVGEKEATQILEADFAGRVGFPQYQISSTRGKIKRLEQKIAVDEKKAGLSGTKEIARVGNVYAVVNYDIDRVQVFFEDKPNDETRDVLKSNGWKWSPKEGAWQRKNTANARYEIKLKLGKLEDAGLIPPAGPVSGASRASSGFFVPPSQGRPAQVESINAIEIPEMLDMVKSLGISPRIGKLRTYLGLFKGVPGQAEIILNPDLFKDPRAAASTLAHEIGHFIDWLPDENISKGNLLNRLVSLRKGMAMAISELSDEGKKERRRSQAKLRKELKAEVAERVGMEVKDATVRKELIDLTQWWKPFDVKQNPNYTKYRHSAAELYADALSVLINSPGDLQERAPVFFKTFMAYLDAKPEVKNAYFETQELISQGRTALVTKRRSAVRGMFDASDYKAVELEQIRQEQDRERRSFRSIWSWFKFELFTLEAKFEEKVKEQEKLGKPVKPEDNPVFYGNERNYVGSRIKEFVERNFQNVFDELEANDLTKSDLREIVYYERILNGDRGKVANPKGLDPSAVAELMGEDLDEELALDAQKEAEEVTTSLRAELGDARYEVLKDLASKFREGINEAFELGNEEGLYSEELMELVRSNAFYVPFKTQKYIDTRTKASVSAQAGTLSDIEDPIVTSIEKVAAIIRAVERNKVARSHINLLNERYPDEIEPAKTRWVGKRKEIVNIEHQDKSKATVIYMEKGKPQGFYADEYVGKTINNSSIGQLRAIHATIGWLNRKWFKPVYIGFNLGFQAFNVVRDFTRFWKNIPDVTMWEAFGLYRKAWQHAVTRGFGGNSELVAEMEREGILGLTYNDYLLGATEEDTQLDIVLQKNGLAEKPSILKRASIGRQVLKMLDFIESLGNTLESMPKVAAYIHFKGDEAGPKLDIETRDFIRRFVGSPDFLARGEWTKNTNAVFLFSNAIIQGIRSDIEIARYGAFNKKANRSSYWYKQAKITVIPKMMMFAAASGLFGELVKEVMDEATEYDKSNYVIIPLGKDENKKAIYLRVPQDETSRFLGATLWKAMRFLSTGDRDKLSDIVSLWGGQVPQVTPAVTLPISIVKFLSGDNVYDSFRQRTVLTETEMLAGGKYKLKSAARYVWNQAGGNIFWKIYSGEPTSTQSNLQKALRLPIVSNVIGRFLKVTDYGKKELLSEVTGEVDSDRARRSLDDRKVVNRYAKESIEKDLGVFEMRQLERDMIKEVIGHYPLLTKEERSRARSLRTKLKATRTRGIGNFQVDAVLFAKSNEAKVELLKKFQDDMKKVEFEKLMKFLKETRTISKSVSSQLRR